VSRTDYLGRQVSVTLVREGPSWWAYEHTGLVIEQDEQGLTLEDDAGETVFHSWLDVEAVVVVVE
jgi:hypothetical protein